MWHTHTLKCMHVCVWTRVAYTRKIKKLHWKRIEKLNHNYICWKERERRGEKRQRAAAKSKGNVNSIEFFRCVPPPFCLLALDVAFAAANAALLSLYLSMYVVAHTYIFLCISSESFLDFFVNIMQRIFIFLSLYLYKLTRKRQEHHLHISLLLISAWIFAKCEKETRTFKCMYIYTYIHKYVLSQ